MLSNVVLMLLLYWKLNVLVYAFRAGFGLCLHTLNLRKEYEPYIGVVVFGKIPLITSILHIQ